MKIYIVRHGQTLFNYLERVQGWSDSPLTEKGIEQGKAVAKYLSSITFDQVYSSDLKRAVDTANFILEEQPSSMKLQTTSLLREAYYGSFEGGTEEGPWGPVFEKLGYNANEIKTNFHNALKEVLENNSNEKIRNMIADNDPLNLAEDFEQYSSRIERFLSKLLLENEAKNVLIVSHGGTSQLITEILLNDDTNISEQDNCSTTIVEIGEDKNTLLDFNNVTYLQEGALI